MWKKLSYFGSLVCLSLAMTVTQAVAQENSREDAVRQVLMELAKAANSADPDKATLCWAEDGLYIDETGGETRGRPALRRMFVDRLAKRPSGEVALHSEAVTFPAENVALAVGAVSHKSGAGDLPGTRFSMVLIKRDKGWLINEVTEAPIHESTAADHLKDLAWMVGKWQVDSANQPPVMEVEWANSRNFILAKITSKRNNQDEIDRQIVGWDPQKKMLVSWHFDNLGGFGCGQWSKESDRWIVDFAGVGADGGNNRARNIFAVTGPDEFTWQSVDRVSAGEALGDTAVLKVKRAKP